MKTKILLHNVSSFNEVLNKATSSSERVISTINNLSNDKKSRLTPGHSNKTVFRLDQLYWEF